jgi:ubiquinone/menaquinone biosynthesis C-methylase UbiE
MSKLNPDDWSSYWGIARVTTFAWQFTNNYDHDFLSFWQSQLSVDCEHIIDLACGNGALVWIADEIVNKPVAKTKITGVDIANIKPFAALGKKKERHPLVSFLANTSIDQLPFADHSIDFAISQYGLEYSQLDKSIAELGRVLAPNSRMAFILHDKQSDVLRDAVPQIPLIKHVLDELHLEAIFLRLDSLYNGAKNVAEMKTRQDIMACRTEINMLLSDIGQREQQIKRANDIELGAPLVANYVEHLKREFPHNAPNKNGKRKHKIIEHTQTLKMGLARIEDLFSAALSDEELQALVGLITQQGFTIVELRKIGYKSANNWGTVLTAQRKAG